MKKVFYVIIAFLLSASSVRAQSSGGKEFWLTFGANYPTGNTYLNLDLRIRIVSGEEATTGTIYFTQSGETVPFSIAAQSVETYKLTDPQKQDVLNTTMGTSNRSVYITSSETVTVYALNQAEYTTDATNVLPIKALGTNYYAMSYYTGQSDAYAVVATENGTQVSHNGSVVATLNTGQVYYRTNATDMTGAYITTNNPVAFFAVNQGSQVPAGYFALDCLFQQLAPVNTWGTTFFVPVSHFARDRVRIIASQHGTTFTQTGGSLVSGSLSLNAGQYAELDLLSSSNGCYIEADQPVGVCTYLVGCDYNGSYPNYMSDPAQCWVPAIEQTITEALIAPFVVPGSVITMHRALIITATATKYDTEFSVNGGASGPLTGGTWIDHVSSNMSYYAMPMIHDEFINYHFTNDAGILVLCYGVGSAESYYYLGFSAMRNLKASFNVNDIYYTELPPVLCEQKVDFHAEITGLNPNAGSLKWYIDDVEEIAARDELEWSKTFAPGEYEIKMGVLFTDNDTTTLVTVFNIGAIISTSEFPAGSGITTGDGCYKVGDPVDVVATPNPGFVFLYWTEGGVEIPGATETYSFTASEDRTLVAHFAPEIPNTAEFYANDIHHENLKDTIFCAKNVDFHAEIEVLNSEKGSLK
ncbi:MAG: hypothetical protein FWG84_10500, partial [Bacteroidales bacterium]|nr:hypothetical protein [Bacteroidales bacterium]